MIFTNALRSNADRQQWGRKFGVFGVIGLIRFNAVQLTRNDSTITTGCGLTRQPVEVTGS
ncbi:hypothetical protein QFZ77_004654 [Paenibacillus sp. V4I3]|nr:hypothetical protein [Paenibacillus sp. V4I3]